jgi:hypothetical protein
MKSFTLSIVTSLLVLALLTSVGNFVNTSLAQDNMTAASNNTGAKMGNQTNQTGGNGGGQQNQTGIGTASQMENLTSGNTGLLQNASDIGSQNTSMTGGMEQEQEATETTSPASTQQQGNQTGEAAQTAMNQTGEALTNASKSDVAQNISQGGQEIGQTVANETGDIFGSISEGLKGLFGMK